MFTLWYAMLTFMGVCSCWFTLECLLLTWCSWALSVAYSECDWNSARQKCYIHKSSKNHLHWAASGLVCPCGYGHLSVVCFTTLFPNDQWVVDFKGFGRNQSGQIVIRNALSLNYKNLENLIICLGAANVIRVPVVYGFAFTRATN
jgi:hypothetical protein